MDLRQPGMHAQAMVPPSARRVIQGTIKTGRRVAHARAVARVSTKQVDAREPKIQLAVRARAAPRGSTKQATAQEARTRYATQMPAHAQEAPVLRVLYVPIMAT